MEAGQRSLQFTMVSENVWAYVKRQFQSITLAGRKLLSMHGIILPSSPCRTCISRCPQEFNSVSETKIPRKLFECLKFILIVEFWLIFVIGKYVILLERLDFCPHNVFAIVYV